MKRNYIKSLLISLILIGSFSFAQNVQLASPEKYQIDLDVCKYPPTEESSFFKVARSQFVKDRMENRENPCSNFVITYGSGFIANPQAQIAFQFAADIWSNLIDSPVDIRVTANFDPAAPGNLGSAGSDGFFSLTGPGIPANTLFPAALTEQLLGQDVDGPTGTSNDINANFNSNRTDWYFGTDANPPVGEFDFVTVVLHELGHGLGVLGFGGLDPSDNTQGRIRLDDDGIPATPPVLVSIWDTFINGTNLFGEVISILDNSSPLNFPDPSASLLDEFQSGSNSDPGTLTIGSPIAVAQNGGVEPNTFAPSTFNPGSSYSHLDENTFNNTPNALMTPFGAPGEATHDPGPIILGFMEDMGWTLCNMTLSTPEITLENIVISPNPFTETLTINLPSNLRNDNFNVSIVDLNGRVIINEDMNTRNGEISIPNLSSLESSLYFITVESLDSDISFTNKIIKR